MIEEIVNFIAQKPSSIEGIQEEYNLSQHELSEMLREAEISGLITRRSEQGKEIYYA